MPNDSTLSFPQWTCPSGSTFLFIYGPSSQLFLKNTRNFLLYLSFLPCNYTIKMFWPLHFYWQIGPIIRIFFLKASQNWYSPNLIKQLWNPAALIKEKYKYNYLEGKNLEEWMEYVFCHVHTVLSGMLVYWFIHLSKKQYFVLLWSLP